MTQRKQRNWVVVVLVWCFLLGIAGAAYRFLIAPRLSGRLSEETGSDDQYKHTVAFAADAFSGYAFLRSSALRKTLKKSQIRLDIRDDQADYKARMQALRDGDIQMAVFTLDAYLKAGVTLGFEQAQDYPGSIVLVIDQTVGADAMVAYKQAIPTLAAMNHPEAQFVLTPNSPSDFLGRVVTGQLSFPLMPERWYAEADGAADVLKKLKGADPKAKRTYVLWEPYLSEALKVPGVHKIFGSDQCQDCIVDVLVVRRQFLKKNRDLVKTIVRGYFMVSYAYLQQPDTMQDLLIADAKQAGDVLTVDQASRIVQGIQWKRTRENYVHFGLEEDPGLKGLDELITYVRDILTKTGAIARDPIGQRATALYFDGIMRELRTDGFHPGRKGDLVAGLGPTQDDLAAARSVRELPALGDAQWAALVPYGNARIEPVGFRRGAAEIEALSQGDLDALARNLTAWSSAYLRVVGRARSEGDPAANASLAQQRADAVKRHLVARGISRNRVRAETAKPGGTGGVAEVAFILGRQAH